MPRALSLHSFFCASAAALKTMRKFKSQSRKVAVLASICVLLIVTLLSRYQSHNACKDRCARTAEKYNVHMHLDNKLLAQQQIGPGNRPQSSDEAYVSLLYHSAFFQAARVLGQSLRESETTRDCGRHGES